MEFKIIIASPYDRESIVAEIWLDNIQIAEVTQENDCPKIEFYQFAENLNMLYDLNSLQNAIEEAKQKLKT